MMPLSIEEGIADGVDAVRKAVRYQIKHGAQLIKCCASGGVVAPPPLFARPDDGRYACLVDVTKTAPRAKPAKEVSGV